MDMGDEGGIAGGGAAQDPRPLRETGAGALGGGASGGGVSLDTGHLVSVAGGVAEPDGDGPALVDVVVAGDDRRVVPTVAEAGFKRREITQDAAQGDAGDGAPRGARERQEEAGGEPDVGVVEVRHAGEELEVGLDDLVFVRQADPGEVGVDAGLVTVPGRDLLDQRGQGQALGPRDRGIPLPLRGVEGHGLQQGEDLASAREPEIGDGVPGDPGAQALPSDLHEDLGERTRRILGEASDRAA